VVDGRGVVGIEVMGMLAGGGGDEELVSKRDGLGSEKIVEEVEKMRGTVRVGRRQEGGSARMRFMGDSVRCRSLPLLSRPSTSRD